MRPTTALAMAALAMGATANQNYLGFNSGATLADRSAKFKKDFEAEFKTAQALQGAPGKFNAVRLYTNIQAYSESDPIEAFEAAIETKTYLLLGVWASGTDSIDNELSALQKAVEKYGDDLTKLIIGISIGSEDLYRVSETGLKNDPDSVGAGPDTIVKFIKDFKKTFKGTGIAQIPVGHVDTWDVWGNSTNKPVIDAVDFLGVDEYPYYEGGKDNSIDNAGDLFKSAYEKTKAVAGGKPVWVTETGWPSEGPDWEKAKTGTKEARKYWVDVGCDQLFGKTPTFWYNLRDSNPDNKMKFQITKDLSTKPLFDLSCDAKDDDDKTTTSASKATKGSSTKTASADDEEETGSGSGSGSGSKSGSKTASADEEEETGSGSGSGSGSKSGSKDESSGAASGTTGTPAPTGKYSNSTTTKGSGSGTASGSATGTGFATASKTGSSSESSSTSGSKSGSDSDSSSSGSGSGSGSGSDSKDGSSTGGDAGSATTEAAGQSSPSQVDGSGAASLPVKGAAYAGLALIAGAFALL